MADIHTETITVAFDWKTFETTLSPTLIEEVQQAHKDGDYLFLLISQTKDEDRHGFETEIDNISLTITGKQEVPMMTG
jgi:hypothetical protein